MQGLGLDQLSTTSSSTLTSPPAFGSLLRSRRILERERDYLLASGRIFSRVPPSEVKTGLEPIGGPCLVLLGPHRLSAVQFYATTHGGATSGNMTRRSSISILQKFLLSAGTSESTAPGAKENAEPNCPSHSVVASPTDKLIKELLGKNPTLNTLMASTTANAGYVRKQSTRTRSLYFTIGDSDDFWLFPTTAAIDVQADDVMVRLGISPAHPSEVVEVATLTMIIVRAPPVLIGLLQSVTADPLSVASFVDFLPRLQSTAAPLPNVPFEELILPSFVPPQVLFTDLQPMLLSSSSAPPKGSALISSNGRGSKNKKKTKATPRQERSKVPRSDGVPNQVLVETATATKATGTANVSAIPDVTPIIGGSRTSNTPIIAPIKKRKYLATALSHSTKKAETPT